MNSCGKEVNDQSENKDEQGVGLRITRVDLTHGASRGLRPFTDA